MSEEERNARNIETLPGSLKEALDIFEKSSLARKILGERAFKRYLEIKRKEWFEYSTRVTLWERQKYLFF